MILKEEIMNRWDCYSRQRNVTSKLWYRKTAIYYKIVKKGKQTKESDIFFFALWKFIVSKNEHDSNFFATDRLNIISNFDGIAPSWCKFPTLRTEECNLLFLYKFTFAEDILRNLCFKSYCQCRYWTLQVNNKPAIFSPRHWKT